MAGSIDDTITRLAAIWAEFLPGPMPGPHTDFFEAGGHSLLATQMLSRVASAFGATVNLKLFYQDPRLDALARALLADPPARRFRFDRVVRLGEGAAKPVFAVVHSNGAFIPLGQTLGREHPFVALQAADRRSGARLPPTVEEIAAGYVRQLRILEPVGPYVVLGWCLAGNLAYEAAQQLRAAGEAVTAVVMVDTWNPAYLNAMGRRRRQVAERSYGWQIILTEFGQVLRGRTRFGDFMRRRNAVRRLAGAPAAPTGPIGAAEQAYLADRTFDQDLLAQLHAAAQSYQPRPYDGTVLRIRSSEEPRGLGLDRRFGWDGLVGAGLRVVTVPGDHLTIFLEPSITLLTRHVREAIGEAGAGSA